MYTAVMIGTKTNSPRPEPSSKDKTTYDDTQLHNRTEGIVASWPRAPPGQVTRCPGCSVGIESVVVPYC